MPTILVDLPTGRRELTEIPERAYRMRRFYIARRPVGLSLAKPQGYEPKPQPRKDFIVEPTGEWEFTLAPNGVQALEVWRAE